jgi:hypothetical protein
MWVWVTPTEQWTLSAVGQLLGVVRVRSTLLLEALLLGRGMVGIIICHRISEWWLRRLNFYYLVARFEGMTENRPTEESLRIADRDIRALERQGLALEHADWRLRGEIKAHGQISLADAAAVAPAHEYDATLVTGAGDDFDSVRVEVTIEQSRDHGV